MDGDEETEGEKEADEEEKGEQLAWHYDDNWHAWVCTAVPAARRATPEDDATSSPSPSGPPTVLGQYAADASKGKGKGKADRGGGDGKGSGKGPTG